MNALLTATLLVLLTFCLLEFNRVEAGETGLSNNDFEIEDVSGEIDEAGKRRGGGSSRRGGGGKGRGSGGKRRRRRKQTEKPKKGSKNWGLWLDALNQAARTGVDAMAVYNDIYNRRYGEYEDYEY